MHKRCCLAMLALVFCVSASRAQQKDPRPNSPVQPYLPLEQRGLAQAEKASSEEKTDAPAFVRATQETPPLSGAWRLALETQRRARNYFLTSFQFQQWNDTNVRNSAGEGQSDTANSVGGRLAFQRIGGRSELTLDYAGAGSFYRRNSELNSSMHQLGIAQKIQLRRWSLLLGDYFSYSPESSFGVGPLGPFMDSGYGLAGESDANQLNVNPGFLPSQTILTARANRFSNTFIGEALYRLSRRSSFTFAGSYATLHFFDPGFVDNRNAIFRTGYNYAVSRRNTIGVIYGFSRFQFSGTDESVNHSVVQLAYGRNVNDRLTFQLAAGPQINRFNNTPAGSDTVISWSLESSLHYRFSRAAFGLMYSRGVTGGSGLFFGAQTHDARMLLNWNLSRNWYASWQVGYGRNTGLREIAGASNGLTFDTLYSRVDLSRSLGRYTRAFLSYNVWRQNSTNPVCSGADCGSVWLRHFFGFGFEFRLRPLPVE